MVTQLPSYDLTKLREQFPVTQHLTYLNHASISPLPLPTQQAIAASAKQLGTDPMGYFLAPMDDIENNLFLAFPAEVARLIHAEKILEIVGVTSTSTAINAVAHAIDWRPGDNVVISEVEFPSNAYPWMSLTDRGVECRLAPAPEGGATLAAIEPLVDDRTRVIAVSAVQFLSGHRTDLATLGEFCHARGIIFAVDAIQSIGHLPLDVQALHIDILASGGQKSMMAPPGQGFLYVREGLAERMTPDWIGPNAVKGWEHWLHYDMTPREGARRFTLGTENLAGMAGAIASLKFLQALGIGHINDWTSYLSQVTIEDLSARGYHVITPTDPAARGPIVTIRIDGADLPSANARADAMMARLMGENVRLTRHLDAAGAPYLRISTHCYNTEDEVRSVGQILGDNTP